MNENSSENLDTEGCQDLQGLARGMILAGWSSLILGLVQMTTMLLYLPAIIAGVAYTCHGLLLIHGGKKIAAHGENDASVSFSERVTTRLKRILLIHFYLMLLALLFTAIFRIVVIQGMRASRIEASRGVSVQGQTSN